MPASRSDTRQVSDVTNSGVITVHQISSRLNVLTLFSLSVPGQRSSGGAGPVGGVRRPHGDAERRRRRGREFPAAAEAAGLLPAAAQPQREEQRGAAGEGERLQESGVCVCVTCKPAQTFVSRPQLHEVHSRLCAQRQVGGVGQGECLSLCTLLESRGIFTLKKAKDARLTKVRTSDAVCLQSRSVDFGFKVSCLFFSPAGFSEDRGERRGERPEGPNAARQHPGSWSPLMSLRFRFHLFQEIFLNQECLYFYFYSHFC